ncbi:MAG: hypothetical protein WC799_17110, partial [Desulfobacteraceae bacterium]|jgi:hypothetical protein
VRINIIRTRIKGKKKARFFNKTVLMELFFLLKVCALSDFQGFMGKPPGMTNRERKVGKEV